MSYILEMKFGNSRGQLCPLSRYDLLWQDNAITRIENLHRLKCLEYINLAMNAIEVNVKIWPDTL